MTRAMHTVLGLLRRAHRRQVSRQAGFALLAVMTAAAMLGALVGEFGYNARVELEAAANARDTLRAEYAARSGVNLARLLIKVQQAVIDPMNSQFKSDFQIIDFAPYLMGAFGGGDDERKSFGDLLGFDASSLKGLGLGKGVTIDPVLGTEDGKININCGGGLPRQVAGGVQGQQNPANNVLQPAANGQLPALTQTPTLRLYTLLTRLFFPPRYNRIFQNATSDGQFYTPDDMARAIIDWSDIDESRFDPAAAVAGGGSAAGEDYRYDSLRDPYKARNNYYDTVEEVNLVRGVGDDFWGSFGSMFTVYGGCQINVRAITQENWPIMAAIARTVAKDPADPALADDNIVSAIAQQMGILIQLPGLLATMDALAKALGSGALPPALAGLSAAAGAAAQGANAQLSLPFPNLPGVNPNPTVLNAIAKMDKRNIYRIDSTGTVKRSAEKKILVRIRAIFDVNHFNQNTTSNDRNDRMGTWVYWRME